MKAVFSRVMLGFIFGTCFCLATFTWFKLTSNNSFIKGTYNRTTDKVDPAFASITPGHLMLSGQRPIIKVSISNNMNFELDTVRGHIDLFDSHGLFGNCWENFKKFKPKEIRELEIDCWAFDSEKVPGDTRIKSSVRYVWVESAS